MLLVASAFRAVVAFQAIEAFHAFVVPCQLAVPSSFVDLPCTKGILVDLYRRVVEKLPQLLASYLAITSLQPMPGVAFALL